MMESLFVRRFKSIVLVALAWSAVDSGYAHGELPPIAPCSPMQSERLEIEAVRWSAYGLRDIYYLKNGDGELLGFFATDGEYDAYAEVCEDIQHPTLRASREWYFWDRNAESAEPAKWSAEQDFSIWQEYGASEIRIVVPLRLGKLEAEWTVVGWDESGRSFPLRREPVVLELR